MYFGMKNYLKNKFDDKFSREKRELTRKLQQKGAKTNY